MNIYAKINKNKNKIFTNKIKMHIKNHDQASVISVILEIQGRFNIWKSISVVHHIDKLKE